MNKLIIPVLLVALLAILTGCGEDKQAVLNEKGELLVYKDFEITENGFYIHDKKEDVFYPVFHGFSGYSGEPSDTDINNSNDQIRNLWISDTQTDPEDCIMDVDNKKTELVLWQKTEGEMPESYFIEKYKKLGYTIGAHFSFGNTGDTVYIDNREHCENSDAEKVLGRFSEQMLRVSRINNDKKLPTQNIDPEISMLLGLEKDKKYQIGLFDGTQYKDVDVIADTLCFKSQQITQLTNPLNITEKNYFVVNLPKNLTIVQ